MRRNGKGAPVILGSLACACDRIRHIWHPLHKNSSHRFSTLGSFEKQEIKHLGHVTGRDDVGQQLLGRLDLAVGHLPLLIRLNMAC